MAAWWDLRAGFDKLLALVSLAVGIIECLGLSNSVAPSSILILSVVQQTSGKMSLRKTYVQKHCLHPVTPVEDATWRK